MIKISETKNAFTNIGNDIYAGVRKGNIIELAHACTEGQTMKPFVRFEIEKKPRVTIRFNLSDFEDVNQEIDNE